MTLTIQDDGKGLPKRPVKGLGLQVMRDRAEVIGASLRIEGPKGKGTRIRCHRPKNHPETGEPR